MLLVFFVNEYMEVAYGTIMCGVGVVLSLCTPSFTWAFAFSFPLILVCSDFKGGDFVCGSTTTMRSLSWR